MFCCRAKRTHSDAFTKPKTRKPAASSTMQIALTPRQPAQGKASQGMAANTLLDLKGQRVPVSRLKRLPFLDLKEWQKQEDLPRACDSSKDAVVNVIFKKLKPTYNDLCTGHLRDILYAEGHDQVPQTRPALFRCLMPASSSLSTATPVSLPLGHEHRNIKYRPIGKEHLKLLSASALSEWCSDSGIANSGSKEILASRLTREVQPTYQDLSSGDLLDMLEANGCKLPPKKKLTRDKMIQTLLNPQSPAPASDSPSAQPVKARIDKLDAAVSARKASKQAGFMVSFCQHLRSIYEAVHTACQDYVTLCDESLACECSCQSCNAHWT